MEQESAYRLSCEILGHSADVRAVCYCPLPARHVILTASRDGTACIWRPEEASSRGYLLKKVVRSHTGYVASLCVIPHNEAFGQTKPLFATGGQDNTVQLHSLEDGDPEPLERYTGHQGTISCIIYQHGNIISASWDSTVRIWREGGGCDVLEAHKPAVWAVAGLYDVDGTKRILTGGADKLVKLWEVETKLCIQEYRGHNDVVRDVKVANKDTFYSAANDCVIRKWSIHTGQLLAELHGHEAFVYSLSLFPGESEEKLVSSGEDKTIRVWKGGVCEQVIPIPAISVWTVSCASNGDIIAGSSDGVARIFTRSSTRVAPSEELASYDTKVIDSRTSSKDNAIDLRKLPGPEALTKQGKEGDSLVINNNGSAEVYQWSSQDAQWMLIGNAMGKVPEKNNVYNGKEYDFVFDIELDEGSPSMRKLKLPYDRSMDPYLAAENFLSTNNLPAYYLDQVAEFIVQNAGEYQGNVGSAQGADPFTGGSRYIPGTGGGATTGGSDPFTGASRYQPGGGGGEGVGLGGGGGGAGFGRGGGADPFTGGSSYRPAEFTSDQPEFNVRFKNVPPSPENSFFPMKEFKLFTSPQDYCDKVLSKIAEFNVTMAEDVKFTDNQLQRLKDLSMKLSNGSEMKSYDLDLVSVMLKWPLQYVFPGLDLVRIVLIGKSGSDHFVGDLEKGGIFLDTLLDMASDSAHPKNSVPAMRCVANLFAHPAGTQVMHTQRSKLLERLYRLFESTNRTYQIALSTIILNYSHYYGTNTGHSEAVKDCVQFITHILTSSYDLEAKFRALIALGTLAKSTPLDHLNDIVQPLTKVQDPAKISQCSLCVLQHLKN